MTKTKRNLIIIFSSLAFLAILVTVGYTGFEYVNNKIEELSKPRTVYSYDDKFEIQLPKRMDFTPTKGEMNKEACFEVRDGLDKYFMITIVESRQQYADLGVDINYDKYIDLYIANFITWFSTDVSEVKEFVTPDSRKIKYVEFDAVVDSNDIHYVAYFFETQNNYAMMLFYSLPANQEIMKMISEDIVPTFKEKGKQAVAPM